VVPEIVKEQRLRQKRRSSSSKPIQLKPKPRAVLRSMEVKSLNPYTDGKTAEEMRASHQFLKKLSAEQLKERLDESITDVRKVFKEANNKMQCFLNIPTNLRYDATDSLIK
jgi:hypothetical protein